MANSADPDQLADLDLHCLQNKVYPGSAGQGLRDTSICKEWIYPNSEIEESVLGI